MFAPATVAYAGGGTTTGADIQVSGSASTGSPNPGASFSYTFQVKNSGPVTATATTFSDALPAATGYLSATANGVSAACTMVNAVVSCALGDLANGSQATVVINLTAPVTAGTFSNTATATSTVADPNTANNSVTVTVQVKTSLANSGVVTYSNFGAVPPCACGSGYGVVGLQTTGFFAYVGDQFTPTVSGAVSSISLPIHQYDTGGNGAFTFQIYTDNAAVPNTLGTLIGNYSGQSIRTTDPSTAVTTISVSNGVKLVAGQTYWVEVQPSSQSRETWTVNQIGALGNHLYSDPNQVDQMLYTANTDQAAFEIKVTP
jgi:uncharacterized repeat protein (TIGR01451 family)